MAIVQCCRNCLNAYNSPYQTKPQCWNKEFEAQFRDIDTSVRPDETCGTWQQRSSDQPPIQFQHVVQLELF